MTDLEKHYDHYTAFICRLLADGTWEAEHGRDKFRGDWFSVACWMNGTHRTVAGGISPADASPPPSPVPPLATGGGTHLGSIVLGEHDYILAEVK